MAEHYDVIIIGTGAGGGTLAHALAGSGKRILLLERGNFLPREMGNWDPRPVFVEGKYISKDTWFDQRWPAVPAPGPLLRRRGDQAVRRGAVPAAAQVTSGNCGTWMACRRRGRCLMTTSSRGIPRPSSCTRCTATAARTRPRATGPRPTPGPRSPTSPGSSRSPTAWRRAVTARSTPRAGSCWTRRTGPPAPASGAPGAMATPAWCTPSPTPRSSRSGRCSAGITSPC